MEKIDYKKIRDKCVDSLEIIKKHKNLLKTLSLIKDKTTKLQTQLDVQKTIDKEIKLLKNFGFKDENQCMKVEKYYDYLKYSIELMSNHWLFTNNGLPDVESGTHYHVRITSHEMVDKLKKQAPFNADDMYHDSISDKHWNMIKKHFALNAKPFMEKAVKFLKPIIKIDIDNLDYILNVKII